MNRLNKIALYSFLILLLIPAYVQAYEISSGWDDLKINDIQGSHVIEKNGDLSVRLSVSFGFDGDYIKQHPMAYFNFGPHEFMTQGPIQNLKIALCSQQMVSAWDYITGYAAECDSSYRLNVSNGTWERAFVYNGEPYLRNYTDYTISFIPNETDDAQYLILLINYTLPNFVIKQGDYYIAWLTFPNMKNKDYQVSNSLVLPTKDDIPRFIPDAIDFNTVPYVEGDKIFYRWVFVFSGGDNRIVWYSNEKELQQKQLSLQEHYTWKGAWIGFFFSLLTAAILAIVQKTFFDKSRIRRFTFSFSRYKYYDKYVLSGALLLLAFTLLFGLYMVAKLSSSYLDFWKSYVSVAGTLFAAALALTIGLYKLNEMKKN
ncbi:MAG: hypothetical protein V1702_00325 [Candidatus Woesearchaeota archaeon]